jgi:hypothetical protein
MICGVPILAIDCGREGRRSAAVELSRLRAQNRVIRRDSSSYYDEFDFDE